MIKNPLIYIHEIKEQGLAIYLQKNYLLAIKILYN